MYLSPFHVYFGFHLLLLLPSNDARVHLLMPGMEFGQNISQYRHYAICIVDMCVYVCMRIQISHLIDFLCGYRVMQNKTDHNFI